MSNQSVILLPSPNTQSYDPKDLEKLPEDYPFDLSNGIHIVLKGDKTKELPLEFYDALHFLMVGTEPLLKSVSEPEPGKRAGRFGEIGKINFSIDRTQDHTIGNFTFKDHGTLKNAWLVFFPIDSENENCIEAAVTMHEGLSVYSTISCSALASSPELDELRGFYNEHTNGDLLEDN